MDNNLGFEGELFSFDAIEQNELEEVENDEESDEINTPKAEIWTDKIGPAPTDYLIVVQTTVDSAPGNTPMYVLLWSHPEGVEYYVSKQPVIEDKELLPQEDRGEPEEAYENVMDAKESRYFNEIFIIDRILDRKLERIKEYEKDTKYAPHCLRVVDAWGQYIDLFAEKYLEESPEQQEYIQVHSRNGRYLYSASHESYARLHELGDIYEHYLGNPPKEKYFIKYLSFKEFPVKYYKYVLPLKILKHIAMEEKLEIGRFLPEYVGKKLEFSPIITSVRGGPAENFFGALTEATIDVNPAIRIYVVVIHCDDDDKPDLIALSKRSRFNEYIEGKYHAFDFEWKDMLLKAYETREIACKDEAYGDLFTRLYKLNEEIAKSNSPYCWRRGMEDSYGFSNVTFNNMVGEEMDISSWSINHEKKPKNLRLMAQSHPSTAVIIDNYETVPLVP